MKRNYYFFTLLLLTLPASCLAKKPYKAVFITPISDAIGSPIKTFFPEISTSQAYAQLPISGGLPLSSSCCPRLHQFLFNEIGTVIKENGQEVLIQSSNCFYITQANNTPQYTYWTLKKNIVSLEQLENQGIDINLFPPAITFEDPTSIENENVATLIKPWFDQITRQTFSSGTRFLKAEDQLDQNNVTVYLFNPQEKKFILVPIPVSNIVPMHPTTPQEKIDLFVHILQSLAHQNHGYIPYVWGGCSFTATADKRFTEKDSASGTAACSYYEIKDFAHTPKPGLDCALLILFAAQQAKIPFFFKNSFTIATYLKKLKPDQALAAGDVIWIPGHVMVVADIAKNTLIEARGYKYKGQGKVQEIELNKVFKKINSFAQLENAWRNHQSLERIGEDGSIIERIKNFKLLSMRSIMEQ